MTTGWTDALLVGGDAAGVCPAIHARLERRRAAASAVIRAAVRRLPRATDLLARVLRGLAGR